MLSAMGKLYCEIIFTTKAPTGDVATWLVGNCEGQWDLHPVGIGADGLTKRFLILFESHRDRSQFATRFMPAAAA